MTENPILSEPTDEEKFRNSPLVTTPAAKRLYFSDLTDDQLMTLFCKAPLSRFQICAVEVACNRSGAVNKLFGFIRVGGVGGELTASQYSLDREIDDAIVIHDDFMFLKSIYCSIAPHSSAVVIHAKLYLTIDKSSDDDQKDEDVETDDDEYLKLFIDDINLDEIDNEYVKAFNTPDAVPAYREKVIQIKDDEPFEFCDESLVVNLTDGASFGCNMLEGEGGFIRVYHVAFKYAVDAVMELEFVADNMETKVDGFVSAGYGNNFEYESHNEKHVYTVKLAITHNRELGDFLMPGKLNLLESALAVPAQNSLRIDACFMDIDSKKVILNGSYEFHVPCDGSCSFGSIAGIDCSLKLKVDWKLPPLDMQLLM